MSSASTIALPYFKSNFTTPVFNSTTPFNCILQTNSNIPAGNYLSWLAINVDGNTDTEIGIIISVIANGTTTYQNTYNLTENAIVIGDELVVFQNTQFLSFATEQPELNLVLNLLYEGNRPTITGTIILYPI